MGTNVPEPVAADQTEGRGERHCGRCRCYFEGDPELAFQTDWGLCPACEAILMPDKGVRIRR